MARFAPGFLENGFIGRLGTVTGSRYNGELYIKRYMGQKNPNSLAQQQVRNTFSILTDITHEAWYPLMSIQRPPLSASEFRPHFFHLNATMFNKANKGMKAADKMNRFQPEKLRLNTGTLQALAIRKAEIEKTAQGAGSTPTYTIRYEFANPYVASAIHKDRSILVFVFDEETQRVYFEQSTLTEASGTAPEMGLVMGFENCFPGSSLEHLHLYLIYADGLVTVMKDSAAPSMTEGDAEEVSQTAHAAIQYNDMTGQQPPVSLGPSDHAQAVPMPAPAPSGKDPAEAAALRNEAQRLMEEAQRLEAEAALADGTAQGR
jgi:hypothetical protein